MPRPSLLVYPSLLSVVWCCGVEVRCVRLTNKRAATKNVYQKVILFTRKLVYFHLVNKVKI